MSTHETKNRERGAAVILAVVGLFAVGLLLVLTSLSLNETALRDAGQARDQIDVGYVALAGLNDAIAEIVAREDGSDARGGGLGALGLTEPVPLLDADGDTVGEYRVWAVDRAADPDTDPPYYVLAVIAAVPNFAQPRAVHGLEASLDAEVGFALAPSAAAISISGPLNLMMLRDWNSSELRIDGNEAAAIAVTDEDAQDQAVRRIGEQYLIGALDGTEITGSPTVTYDHSEYMSGSPLEELDLSLVLDPTIPFTAEQLNAYRDALRGYAEGLVGATPTADGTSVDVDYEQAERDGVTVVHRLPDVADGAGAGKPRIVSDLSLGSEQTVLVDTSQFFQGGDMATDNHDRTLTGSGTLVILHPIGSKSDNDSGKQFNLNWEGDVFVVGYPADRTDGVGQNRSTDNMLYISRSDWNIDGNLVVVTAGRTEASLEMQGTGANPAVLDVTGSVLLFAEASTQEAEIDIEAHATMKVDGIVGLYGSRIEIENRSHTNTVTEINGTLAIGIPAGNPRIDDYYHHTRGRARFTYDRENVKSAVLGLTELQSELDLGEDQASALTFSTPGSIAGPHLYERLRRELQALLDASGPDPRLGVDVQRIEDSAAP